MSDAMANLALELRRGKTELLCGHWDRVHDAIRELFPIKTAQHLSEATGLSVRACEYSLSERRALSSDALVALLHTQHGPRILRAMMGDSQIRWWRRFRNMWERERVKIELADLKKRLAALDEEVSL